jgi:hypothetical protein
MGQLLACTVLLGGFIAAMKFGLNRALEAWGLGPYALLCLTIIGGAIAAAFAYDRAQARSRRSPPRELNPGPPSRQ